MITYMEFVRGLPELRPMIAGRFDVLDPECYYPAIPMHVDEDERFISGDIFRLPKGTVIVYENPETMPHEMDLYIGEYRAFFLEVTEGIPEGLDENASL